MGGQIEAIAVGVANPATRGEPDINLKSAARSRCIYARLMALPLKTRQLLESYYTRVEREHCELLVAAAHRDFERTLPAIAQG